MTVLVTTRSSNPAVLQLQVELITESRRHDAHELSHLEAGLVNHKSNTTRSINDDRSVEMNFHVVCIVRKQRLDVTQTISIHYASSWVIARMISYDIKKKRFSGRSGRAALAEHPRGVWGRLQRELQGYFSVKKLTSITKNTSKRATLIENISMSHHMSTQNGNWIVIHVMTTFVQRTQSSFSIYICLINWYLLDT